MSQAPRMWHVVLACLLTALMSGAASVRAVQKPSARSPATCPEGTEAEGQPLLATFHVGEATIWACGSEPPEPGNDAFHSEFWLIDAATKRSLWFVSAVDEGTLKQEGDHLVFTLYRRYPLGPGPDWEDLPFQATTLVNDATGFHSSCQQLFDRPHFTPKQLETLWSRYQKAREGGQVDPDLWVLPMLAWLDGDARYDPDTIAHDLRIEMGEPAEDLASVREDVRAIHEHRCLYGIFTEQHPAAP